MTHEEIAKALAISSPVSCDAVGEEECFYCCTDWDSVHDGDCLWVKANASIGRDVTQLRLKDDTP